MQVIQALKTFSESKNWRFIHARRDYQNLSAVSDFFFSETEKYGEGETFLFLDPVSYNVVSGVCSGNFMILTNSDPDNTYDEKFENYIEPLIPLIEKQLHNVLRCSFDVNSLNIIEVINVFDFNADGVSVSFNLKVY